ncbi:hypothetical protein [Gracilimonas tropica]|uniref:hypothetical protein n=1 Tax=Gracilimonas tropica TaxID=454600 RepID=UPI00039C0B0F|nr:hypothetical protein [Gracilimonas tropica]
MMNKTKNKVIDNRPENYRLNGSPISSGKEVQGATVNWPHVGCLALIAAFWIALFYFAFKGMGLIG